MPRFLIEVTHSDEFDTWAKALRAIEQFGSHFITHADWGCEDDVHSCWMIMELESRDEAIQLVPMAFRQHARVVRLNRFDGNRIKSRMADLGGDWRGQTC